MVDGSIFEFVVETSDISAQSTRLRSSAVLSVSVQIGEFEELRRIVMSDERDSDSRSRSTRLKALL